MANGPMSIEQRLLEADAQVEQLALKLHASEKRREDLLLLVHKLAWIATFEGMAVLLLAFRLFNGVQP